MTETDFASYIPEFTKELSLIPNDIKLSQDPSVPDAHIFRAGAGIAADVVDEAQKIAQGLQLSLASSPLVLQMEQNEPHFDYRHESQRGSQGGDGKSVSRENNNENHGSSVLTQNTFSSSQQQQGGSGSQSQTQQRAQSPSPYLLSSSH